MLFGTEEQKHYYMDFLLNGKLGAFALTEPDAGSDAGATRTTAVRDGDDYILNGRKCFITSGGLADVYTVFATVDRSLGTKGITCFIVEKDRPGVSVGKAEDKMGMVLSNTTDLLFENVRIPAKNRVGEEGRGFKIAMTCLDRSRGVNSYGALGIAQRAIDESVAYAKQRKTFGKPIIAHQMVQGLLAGYGDPDHRRPGPAVALRPDGGRGSLRLQAGRRHQGLHQRRGHAGDHQCGAGTGRLRLLPGVSGGEADAGRQTVADL